MYLPCHTQSVCSAVRLYDRRMSGQRGNAHSQTGRSQPQWVSCFVPTSLKTGSMAPASQHTDRYAGLIKAFKSHYRLLWKAMYNLVNSNPRCGKPCAYLAQLESMEVRFAVRAVVWAFTRFMYQRTSQRLMAYSCAHGCVCS